VIKRCRVGIRVPQKGSTTRRYYFTCSRRKGTNSQLPQLALLVNQADQRPHLDEFATVKKSTDSAQQTALFLKPAVGLVHAPPSTNIH